MSSWFNNKGQAVFDQLLLTFILYFAVKIIKEVTNESWENNIEDNIFAPLQMTNTFTNLEDVKEKDNFSLGYGLYRNNIKKVNFEKYHDYKPAGGIRSTSKDLSNWMIDWLNSGNYDSAQAIPLNFAKKVRMFNNSRDGDDEPDLFLQGYGLGWRVEVWNGEFRVQHGGNTSGFTSLLVTYPFKKFGVTVLVNQDDSTLPYIVAFIVQNRLLQIKGTDTYPVSVQDIYQPSDINESLNNKKPHSKSLDSFVGVYEHKGYGKIKIKLEDDKLYAIYPTCKFFLEHLHYNIFVMKPLSDVFNPEFALNFKMTSDSEISSFTIWTNWV